MTLLLSHLAGYDREFLAGALDHHLGLFYILLHLGFVHLLLLVFSLQLLDLFPRVVDLLSFRFDRPLQLFNRSLFLHYVHLQLPSHYLLTAYRILN